MLRVMLWQDMKLFSGNANVELAEQIAGLLGKELGNITVSRFADGTLLTGVPTCFASAAAFPLQVRSLDCCRSCRRSELHGARERPWQGRLHHPAHLSTCE
jgi:hypothetical protein